MIKVAPSVVFTLPVSPVTTIVLHPPEQLVLEIRVTGGYKFSVWFRNGEGPDSKSFFDFGDEIYLVEETNSHDLGVYEVQLGVFPDQVAPAAVKFHVVEQGISAFLSVFLTISCVVYS